jgi:hypothetical protein
MKYSSSIKSVISYALALTLCFVSNVVLNSCKTEKGCTDPEATNYNETAEEDDGSCEDKSVLVLTFSYNFDGQEVTYANRSEHQFTTESNDLISFENIKYLISDVVLHKENGGTVHLYDYHFINLRDEGTHATAGVSVDKGNYTTIEFTLGFDKTKNDSQYEDLASLNWKWPIINGGGWHYLDIFGYYRYTYPDSYSSYSDVGFSFVYGRAMLDGVLEENNTKIKLPSVNLTGDKSSVEIKMNLADWFKNPSTWEFGKYSSTEIQEHEPQKLIQAQAETVFSIGKIINQD